MTSKLGKTVPVVVSMAIGAGIALAAEKTQRPPIAPSNPRVSLRRPRRERVPLER